MTAEFELPLGIWKTVCSFLPLEDKRAVRQVAHIFRDAADESIFRAIVADKADGCYQSVGGILEVSCQQNTQDVVAHSDFDGSY